MEFKFNVSEIFPGSVVEINQNLVPPGFTGDRRALWDVVTKVSEVVNSMGGASAAAQGLTKPITTADRLRNSEQTIYLLVDKNAKSGKGVVTGMLKTGKKSLYVFDRDGHHYQVSPPCVLDFYVHESRQRTGLGKQLFEHMLQKEKVEPVKLAVDRPSEKLLSFLDKHYGLNSALRQMNNYVVFDGFFPEPQDKNVNGDSSNSGSPSKTKQSANGLQPNFASPYGRYGAPRPPCSMGQIIHNQSPVQSNEPTGCSLNMKSTKAKAVSQSTPAMNQQQQEVYSSQGQPNVCQSVPNMPPQQPQAQQSVNPNTGQQNMQCYEQSTQQTQQAINPNMEQQNMQYYEQSKQQAQQPINPYTGQQNMQYHEQSKQQTQQPINPNIEQQTMQYYEQSNMMARQQHQHSNILQCQPQQSNIQGQQLNMQHAESNMPQYQTIHQQQMLQRQKSINNGISPRLDQQTHSECLYLNDPYRIQRMQQHRPVASQPNMPVQQQCMHPPAHHVTQNISQPHFAQNASSYPAIATQNRQTQMQHTQQLPQFIQPPADQAALVPQRGGGTGMHQNVVPHQQLAPYQQMVPSQIVPPQQMVSQPCVPYQQTVPAYQTIPSQQITPSQSQHIVSPQQGVPSQQMISPHHGIPSQQQQMVSPQHDVTFQQISQPCVAPQKKVSPQPGVASQQIAQQGVPTQQLVSSQHGIVPQQISQQFVPSQQMISPHQGVVHQQMVSPQPGVTSQQVAQHGVPCQQMTQHGVPSQQTTQQIVPCQQMVYPQQGVPPQQMVSTQPSVASQQMVQQSAASEQMVQQVITHQQTAQEVVSSEQMVSPQQSATPHQMAQQGVLSQQMVPSQHVICPQQFTPSEPLVPSQQCQQCVHQQPQQIVTPQPQPIQGQSQPFLKTAQQQSMPSLPPIQQQPTQQQSMPTLQPTQQNIQYQQCIQPPNSEQPAQIKPQHATASQTNLQVGQNTPCIPYQYYDSTAAAMQIQYTQPYCSPSQTAQNIHSTPRMLNAAGDMSSGQKSPEYYQGQQTNRSGTCTPSVKVASTPRSQRETPRNGIYELETFSPILQDQSGQMSAQSMHPQGQPLNGEHHKALDDTVSQSPKLERPRSLSIQRSEDAENLDKKISNDIKGKVHSEEPQQKPGDELDNIENDVEKIEIAENVPQLNAANSSAKNSVDGSDDSDNRSKSPNPLTAQGFFDLKFYHSRLW